MGSGDIAGGLEFPVALCGHAAVRGHLQGGGDGHSYGAQAVLAWRARPNSALDAVVFLDSTVEYGPLADAVSFKAALERNRNASAPC